MKQTLLVALFIVLVSPLYAQDEIRWMSMNEALEAQKKSPKKNYHGRLYQLVWPL